MSPQDVRDAIKASPFRPFTIVYKTGRVFPIRNADEAWMPPSSDSTKVFVVDETQEFTILDTSWILNISFDAGASHRKAS